MTDAFWIILTGSLVAAACSLLGSFLILRKMAMVGDAISHAVLPGIVFAYLISGSRASFPMLVGAAVVGILTTWIIEVFQKRFKVQSDASIGVTFTMLFAIGVIMISALGGQVELDQECVLYGEIAYVPLDLWFTASGISMGPYSTWIIGTAFVIVLGFVVLGFNALKITTFDEKYAASIGISTVAWHYALMGMVSLTTVVSFEAVGAILVVAFFIIPPATAYLMTHDLKKMILLSVLLGVLSSTIGYFFALWLNSSIAGAMVTVAGVIFFLVFLITRVQQKRRKEAVIAPE